METIVSFIYMISFGEYHKIGKTTQSISCKGIKRFQQYDGNFKICLLMSVDSSIIDKVECAILDKVSRRFKISKGREYFYGDEREIRAIVANHIVALPIESVPIHGAVHHTCDKCGKMLCTALWLTRHRKLCGSEKSSKIKITTYEEYMDAKSTDEIKGFIKSNVVTVFKVIESRDEFALFEYYDKNRDYMMNLAYEVDNTIAMKKKNSTNERFEHIQNVCNMLGLEHTLDDSHSVSDEELKNALEYFKEHSVAIKSLFSLRRGLDNIDKMRPRSAITVINGMLKYWNGSSFMVLSSAHDNKSRTNPNKDYVCKLEIPTDVPNLVKDMMKSRAKVDM